MTYVQERFWKLSLHRFSPALKASSHKAAASLCCIRIHDDHWPPQKNQQSCKGKEDCFPGPQNQSLEYFILFKVAVLPFCHSFQVAVYRQLIEHRVHRPQASILMILYSCLMVTRDIMGSWYRMVCTKAKGEGEDTESISHLSSTITQSERSENRERQY